MNNIIKKYKFRQYRKLLIWSAIGAVAVTGITIGVVFSSTSKVNARKAKIMKLYSDLFVKRSAVALTAYPNLKPQVQKILDALNLSTNSHIPVYHFSANFTTYTKNEITICQIEDFNFTKGTGEYQNWGAKVVFLFKKDELMEINYQNKDNHDTQLN